VIAGLRIGSGDYLLLKDKLFGAETVKSLSAKIMKYQIARKKAERPRSVSRRKPGAERARRSMISGKNRA
jgi:hypothetical protein